jgi:holo-[acyl-carrier protein] synthase
MGPVGERPTDAASRVLGQSGFDILKDLPIIDFRSKIITERQAALIFGIGTDIVEIGRVEDKLCRTRGLREKIFTPREIAYSESRGRSGQHFAARFAAKEAFFKAMGTGWRSGFRFDEVEIVNNELGKPEAFVHGKVKSFCEANGIGRWHVTLSHSKDLAKAVVVLEKD